MNKPYFSTRCVALFTAVVSRLLSCRWASDYREHVGACEEGCSAHIGLLHLAQSYCLVLDHQDARISLHLPIWYRRNGRWQRGQLRLGWQVCTGSEPIRSAGPDVQWYKPYT
jgi:hypothetical protein